MGRATFGKAAQSALPPIPKLELPCKKDSVSGVVAFKKSKSVLTHVKMVKKPTNKNANNFKGPKSSRSVAQKALKLELLTDNDYNKSEMIVQ